MKSKGIDWFALLIAIIVTVVIVGNVRLNFGIKKLKLDAEELSNKVDEGKEEQEEIRAKVDEKLEESAVKEVFVSVENLVVEEASEELSEWYNDIPLNKDLMNHLFLECESKGVNPEHILKIMWNESRFEEVGSVMDVNGYLSAGRMQINAGENNAIWNWLLDEYGLDVHDEKDNISAGILILSLHKERYGEDERAVVAYQCGQGTTEKGGIYSTSYSRWVMSESSIEEILEAM